MGFLNLIERQEKREGRVNSKMVDGMLDGRVGVNGATKSKIPVMWRYRKPPERVTTALRARRRSRCLWQLASYIFHSC